LYKFIYHRLLIKKNPSLVFLVVSLGIYVVLSNIISIVWKDGTKSIRPSFIGDIISFNGFYIADFHLITIITTTLLIIVFSILQNHSKLGIQYVASSENEKLSKIFGINVERNTLFFL
jgi:branched-subunit amino acid ABC-type transport system permease component